MSIVAFFIFTNRLCALVALEDVKTYLNEEGGQIAVRIYTFHFISIIYWNLMGCVVFKNIDKIQDFLLYMWYNLFLSF